MLIDKELNDILIAKEVLNLLTYKQDNNTDFLSYITFKNKEEVVEKVNINQAIEKLLNNINPFTFVVYKQRKPLFLNELIEITYDETDLRPLLNNINKENISEVPDKYLLKILDSACTYKFWETVECLFKNGFIFNQGDTNEALEFQIAVEGNHNFFEILYKYQPDFNFTKKYLMLDHNNDYDIYKTLLEAVTEKQMKRQGSTKQIQTNKKSKYDTTIEVLLTCEKQRLYQKLNETVENKDISKKLKL